MFTNVIGEKDYPENKDPKDFYRWALSRINFNLNNCENLKLKNIIFDRTIIKRSIMTVPYNISLSGMGDQLLEHFNIEWTNDKSKIIIPAKYARNNQNFEIEWKDFGELTSLVFNTINMELPSINKLNNYLDKLIDIISKYDLPVSWVTPAGMKISLSTVKLKS